MVSYEHICVVVWYLFYLHKILCLYYIQKRLIIKFVEGSLQVSSQVVMVEYKLFILHTFLIKAKQFNTVRRDTSCGFIWVPWYTRQYLWDSCSRRQHGNPLATLSPLNATPQLSRDRAASLWPAIDWRRSACILLSPSLSVSPSRTGASNQVERDDGFLWFCALRCARSCDARISRRSSCAVWWCWLGLCVCVCLSVRVCGYACVNALWLLPRCARFMRAHAEQSFGDCVGRYLCLLRVMAS